MSSEAHTRPELEDSGIVAVKGSSHHNNTRPKRRVPREVRFGCYILGATLGEGEFGKVKLGWRKDGKQPSQTAIKLIRRDTIPQGSERENKIHREINALKRLRHPNIVRLVEVLQNEKYVGIVLEYASGGELFDYILEHRCLKEATACRLFAQLVSGVDYMHSKGLVHRDLKLENLLLDKHKNIVISDFGFVNSFRNHTDLMKTSCGSPCYAAPELVVSNKPYKGTKVDVWSCGVILYAMLAGYLPYDDDPQNPDGENIARLYRYITTTPLTFPEYITPTPRDLLRRVIVPDPGRRLSLRQVRSHPWLAPHAPFLSVTPVEWDRNYNTARLMINSTDRAHHRYSLMETPMAMQTSRRAASLMINPHSIRSYSSGKASSSFLYSHPAAPQTSKMVAISSSPSKESGEGSATEKAALLGDEPGYREADGYEDEDEDEDEDMESREDQERRKHEKPQWKTKSSRPISAAVVPQSHHSHRGEPFPRYYHRQSNSTASIALQAVVEKDNAEHSRRNSLLYTSQVQHDQHSFPKPLALAGYTSYEAKRGPQRDRKQPGSPAISTKYHPRAVRVSRPRPTSFHPGMAAPSSIQLGSRDLSFMVPQSGEVNPKSSLATLSTSKSNRNSWCQPKISEPALDMSMVSGVLTKLDSMSLTESEGSSSPRQHEKRRSIALDSLSTAMEIFSVSEKNEESVEDEKLGLEGVNTDTLSGKERASGDKRSAGDDAEKTYREKELQAESGEGANGTERERAERERTEKTQITQRHPASSNRTVSSESHHHHRHHHHHHATQSEDYQKISVDSQGHVSRMKTSGSEKENRMSIGTSMSSKFKRFSLLSFYNRESSSSPHYTSQNATKHLSMAVGGHRDRVNAGRRPLVQRNGEAVGDDAKEQPSTAKRVMDFFRRRSIRI